AADRAEERIGNGYVRFVEETGEGLPSVLCGVLGMLARRAVWTSCMLDAKFRIQVAVCRIRPPKISEGPPNDLRLFHRSKEETEQADRYSQGRESRCEEGVGNT